MQIYKWFFSLVLVFFLSGCASEIWPSLRSWSTIASVETSGPTAPVEAYVLAANCPEPTAGTALFKNSSRGYCLLYPEGYSVVRANEYQTSLVIGGLLNVAEPRLDILVEDIGGRTLEQVADDLQYDYVPGPDIERSTITVAGAEAVVLDNVPGQEFSRRVVFVHENRLYHLIFLPADEDLGEVYTRMETLYRTVVDSFTFIPVVEPTADNPVSFCPEPTGDVQLLVNEREGYCAFYPSGYIVEQPSDGIIVLVVGGLLDAEHARAHIEVEEALGRTAEEVAMAVAEEFKNMGIDVEVSFGISVGGEGGWQLDNVPGQDVNRQVFAVHAGRLYRFLFAPADSERPEVYAQMATLYETLIHSFTFIPPTAPTGIPLSPSVVGEAAGNVQTDCSQPIADQALVRNEAAGYCFTIPVGYEAEFSEDTTGVVVRAPVTSAGDRVRLLLYVEKALGRSLAQVTAQTLADYAIPGMEGEVSSNVSVGGEPATVIRKLPGQDPNRRVMVVHDGRVYEMMFIPDHPEMGQAYEEMEALFTAVMDSFTFIPPTAPMGMPLPSWQEGGYPADAVLSWERRIYNYNGGTIAACQRLAIAADGTTWAGSCEGVEVEVATAPFQWNEIRNRFAPIVFRGGDWDLFLAGQGDIYHPAWVQALGAWAQVSYGETVSGRTSATARMALSWWLGEVEGEAGRCKHLVVLSHGYTYANVDPCAGGDSQTVAEGWLETAEMAAFDRWLNSAPPTYVEDSYLDGRGEQELSQEEIEQLAQWAQQVYQRLVEDNP